MAEKIKADDEPSIEEILDSIRQIISEDDRDASVSSSDEPESNASIDDIFGSANLDESESDFDTIEDEDVFELIERIEPEPIFERPAETLVQTPPQVSVAKIEEQPFVVDLIDETIENEPEPEVEKIVKELPADPAIVLAKNDLSHGDSILTEAAENAAFSAIAELARKTAVEHSGITLEDIVRAEIKPLLRGWLDKNLPIVIERLVREELERVSKRVLED